MQAEVSEREGTVSLEGKLDAGRLEDLAGICRELRRDIVKMIGTAGSGHPGGSLSCVEILVSLYFYKMRHRPDDPRWPGRDRFVLSKGHAAPALYAVLSRCGYFSRDELWKLRRLGGMLQGHPDSKRTPGVEISTGSLGQGLAAACGMALALRLDRSDSRVYCLIGDGESQEGQIWESSMLASHYCLDNLVAVIDLNGLQIDGACCEVMDLGDVSAKWRSFGWQVQEVDGHDLGQLCRALDLAGGDGLPCMIVARTVKGKGVSFMENNVSFHGKAPTPEEVERALAELGEG